MATDALEDAAFWLPTEFLTDDDILMDKENLLKSETHKDKDDLLTELTRQLTRSTLQGTHKFSSDTHNLEKSWGFSGSPQSTLNGLGSWSINGSQNGHSQMSSPPTSPLGANEAVLDLKYQAAGQVARLKMDCNGPTNGRALPNEQRTLTGVHTLQFVKTPNSGFCNHQCVSHAVLQDNHQVRQKQVVKQQVCGIWGRQEKWYSQNSESRVCCEGGGGYVESGRWNRPQPLGFGHSVAWPALQVQKNHTQQLQKSGSGMKSVFLGGSGGGGGGGGVNRECAGTGVFLPRCYGNLTGHRKKPGCSTALLPARVVHALNKNFDDLSIHTLPQAQTRFNDAFIPEYDLLMARRSALVAEQRGRIRAEGGVK